MSDGNLIQFPFPEEHEPSLPPHVLYQINDLLPEGQQLCTIPPTTRASDALKVMKELGYSQLPVVHNLEVVGVFSHRSFVDGVLSLEGENKLRAEDLPVADFLEQLSFADVRTDVDEILDRLDTHNAVLIGSPRALVGIATPMDALWYFHRLTSAFLLLQEIERAIRALRAFRYDHPNRVGR
jgi:CBS domain-containing protein